MLANPRAAANRAIDNQADAIPVALDQRHIACPAHAEPFRATFPLGWPAFAMAVSTAALASPMLQTGVPRADFWNVPNLRWGDLPPDVGPDRIRAMLEAVPACEWVEPPVLLAAYLGSGIGIRGVCRSCGIIRAGTPYGVVSGRGHDVIPHVCFVCVATGQLG